MEGFFFLDEKVDMELVGLSYILLSYVDSLVFKLCEVASTIPKF